MNFEEILTTATSLSFDQALLILALISTIVFYAKDFRIGLLSSFIVVALVYIFLYVLNMDTTLALTVLLIIIVILALSIYLTASRADNPLLPR